MKHIVAALQGFVNNLPEELRRPGWRMDVAESLMFGGVIFTVGVPGLFVNDTGEPMITPLTLQTVFDTRSFHAMGERDLAAILRRQVEGAIRSVDRDLTRRKSTFIPFLNSEPYYARPSFSPERLVSVPGDWGG